MPDKGTVNEMEALEEISNSIDRVATGLSQVANAIVMLATVYWYVSDPDQPAGLCIDDLVENADIFPDAGKI